MRGFEGALVGQLVSKDVERGEFVLRVEKVLAVSKNNKAQNTKSSHGRRITIRGISNRYLDELLLFKTGNRMEVGAIHLRGEYLSFSIYAGKFRKIGKDSELRRELSKKEPEDVSEEGFPVGMRGFRGVLIGRVVSRDFEKGEVVVRVESVKRVGKQNKSHRTRELQRPGLHAARSFWEDTRRRAHPQAERSAGIRRRSHQRSFSRPR